LVRQRPRGRRWSGRRRRHWRGAPTRWCRRCLLRNSSASRAAPHCVYHACVSWSETNPFPSPLFSYSLFFFNAPIFGRNPLEGEGW
jgi:hypothetical protein